MDGADHEPGAGHEKKGAQQADVRVQQFSRGFEQLSLMQPVPDENIEEYGEQKNIRRDQDPNARIAGRGDAGGGFRRAFSARRRQSYLLYAHALNAHSAGVSLSLAG